MIFFSLDSSLLLVIVPDVHISANEAKVFLEAEGDLLPGGSSRGTTARGDIRR